MKQALILGCSHAAGSEMWHDPACEVKDVWRREQYGALHSYPVLIAKRLGYHALNHAIAGGSNDAMFRIGLDVLPTLKQSDCVIACWTGRDRTEIYHDTTDTWIPICGGAAQTSMTTTDPVLLQGRCTGRQLKDADRYQTYAHAWTMYEVNSQRGRVNKIKNILAFNQVAEYHAVPVINIWSFDPVSDFPMIGQWPIGQQDFFSWCQQHEFAKTANGHFFLDAHQTFADFVLEKILN